MTRLAAVLLAVTLAACGDAATVAPREDASSGGSYAADAVLLRVTYEGGFLPLPPPARIAAWTLYGDGRVVTPGGQIDIYPSPAMPSVQVAKVDAETVDRILREARAAGVDGQQRDYGDPPVADAATTVFRLGDEQGEAEVRVYALAEHDGGNDARRTLRGLLDNLTRLEDWLGAERVGEWTQYEPASLAVFAAPYADVAAREGPEQEPRAWQGPDPAAGEQTVSGRCMLLTGAELAARAPGLRESNVLTPWTYGGKTWAFQLRPLLPDERTCADTVAPEAEQPA